MSFYAVKAGRATGIFNDWGTCKRSVIGFSGAVYKKFKTQNEAESYLGGSTGTKKFSTSLLPDQKKRKSLDSSLIPNQTQKPEKKKKTRGSQWVEAIFKQDKEVLVKMPLPESGLIKMKYKTSDKIYTANLSNITLKNNDGSNKLTTFETEGFGKAGKRTETQAAAAREHIQELLKSFAPNSLICYTDGACKGNPGPAGAGVYVQFPAADVKTGKSLKRYSALGQATNNIAELTAIKMALELVEKTRTENPQETPWNDIGPIQILSDSEYAIGILSGWEAKKISN